MAALATTSVGLGSHRRGPFPQGGAGSLPMRRSARTVTSFSRCFLVNSIEIQSQVRGLKLCSRLTTRPAVIYCNFVDEYRAKLRKGRGWRKSLPGAIAAAAADSAPAGRAAEETVGIGGWSISRANLEVTVVAVATVVLSTANKVLYKMALVPMKEFPFFLAQVTTFGYVAVYSAVLYARYRTGAVTDSMLSLPKAQFVCLGALEALGLASGMAAAAVLPAAAVPVLLQVFLVWQLLLSYLLLGKRYTRGQVVGCLLVVAGVLLVVASGSGGSETAKSLNQSQNLWALLMILSSLFSAGGSIVKESVFRTAERTLDGGSVDIFVVNTFGSSFQALFVLLMLPFLSSIRGIPFHRLGHYLRDGSACFFNAGSSIGCDGSPALPILYLLANIGFNVAALYLMKISSAILSSLTTTVSVPLAVYAFTFPLPYLGAPPPLPPRLLAGSVVLVAGLAFYHISNPKVHVKLE